MNCTLNLNLKINEYNGSEANKDKQVKIGNISTGEYVNKKAITMLLNETLKGKETELATANTLIADLKKATNGNEDLQAKISGYENRYYQSTGAAFEETRLKSAVKVALLSAKSCRCGIILHSS